MAIAVKMKRSINQRTKGSTIGDIFNQIKTPRGLMLAMGIIIGTTVGSLTDNIGVWIAIGSIVGTIAEYAKQKTISSQ